MYLRFRHFGSARRNIDHIRTTATPAVQDSRGNLLVIDKNTHPRLKFNRVFFLKSENPTIRGNHAHLACHQTFQVLSGTAKLRIRDGYREIEIVPSNHTELTEVPSGLWVEVELSKECLILVYADRSYRKSDYIRSYQHFLEFKGH